MLGAARLLAAVFLVAALAPAQAWVIRDHRPLLTSSVCWDSWRDRGVLVAAKISAGPLFVHEWDGTRWTPCDAPAIAPQLTSENRFIARFDQVRRRTVVLVAGVPQTWAWTGQSWVTLTPPPFTPRWTTLAFDTANARFVVFDTGATQGINQTWHFDGATWTQVASNTPIDDVLSTSAYDPVRARTVLRAGTTTFEWDGAAWTGGQTVVRPPQQYAMVFDPQRGKAIVASTGSTHWEWSGTDWVPYAVPSPSTGTFRPGFFFFDERRSELVLYDDWSGTTQRLGPAGWTVAQRLPSTGGGLQLTADVTHGHVVAVETPSILNPNPPPTTLRWTPSGWQSLGLSTMPVRLSAAQADRDLAGVVYRFGGLAVTPTTTTDTDELYAFDGTTWSLVNAPNAPAPRSAGALATDTARQRVVAFGGRSGTNWWNDTREFDGVQWFPKFPAHAPSPRAGHAMCFSPSLGRVFLFGGTSATTGTVQDFWSWDGTDWTQLPSPPSGPVSQFGLASHDAAGTVVLTVVGVPSTTWAWNGTAWSQLGATPFAINGISAEPRLGGVLAPLAGALLTTQPAAVAPFGSGCAGSAGTPTLRPFGRPGLGNASYAFEVETALPGASALILAHGFAPANVPLPGGCTLLVTPVAADVLVAPAGFGAFALAVPDDLALRGASIFSQGAVLDPATPAGFVTTARLTSLIAD